MATDKGEVVKLEEAFRRAFASIDANTNALIDFMAVICPLTTAIEEVVPGTKLKIARSLEGDPEAAKRSPRKELIEFMRYGLPPDLRVVD